MKWMLTLLLSSWSLFTIAQQAVCEAALGRVHTDSLVYFINTVTGQLPVHINNSEQTILSRFMTHPGNNLAAEYLKQTVIGYGWNVEDLPFSSSGRNIIAYKSGTVNPKRAYLIGAHYDCVGNATMNFQGADDNASGVAALLETARVLQNDTFPYSIILAFWDEEEQGLIGSMAFAPDGPRGYWDIMASINLDMIGYDGNHDSLAMVHSFQSGHSDVLASKLVEVNRLYHTGLNLHIKNPGDQASDHYSFWLKASTAVGLTEDYDFDFNPNWHQQTDQLINMDTAYFVRMSSLACAAICEISQTGNYVSVKEVQRNTFSLYPNPVSDRIVLPANLLQQKGGWELYSLLGEKVPIMVTDGSINVSEIAQGMYILVFKTPETTYTARVIKQ